MFHFGGLLLTFWAYITAVAKYYKAADTFTCINNPNIKIPVSSVNDDVCDCPDGSDEVYFVPYRCNCCIFTE